MFFDLKEKLVLLCIDTDKVKAQIKWEDHNNYGNEYPHIYGELSTDAVMDSFPFQKDNKGVFELNSEIEQLV